MADRDDERNAPERRSAEVISWDEVCARALERECRAEALARFGMVTAETISAVASERYATVEEWDRHDS